MNYFIAVLIIATLAVWSWACYQEGEIHTTEKFTTEYSCIALEVENEIHNR